ncbi:unnamed protein product, partial [Ectocarpus sp. 13 AM-2016]
MGPLFPLKVILSTHAVVANGGLIALNGSHAVALAANDLSVPVVCVTGLFKVQYCYCKEIEIAHTVTFS